MTAQRDVLALSGQSVDRELGRVDHVAERDPRVRSSPEISAQNQTDLDRSTDLDRTTAGRHAPRSDNRATCDLMTAQRDVLALSGQSVDRELGRVDVAEHDPRGRSSCHRDSRAI
jgi:hypothetical protein